MNSLLSISQSTSNSLHCLHWTCIYFFALSRAHWRLLLSALYPQWARERESERGTHARGRKSLCTSSIYCIYSYLLFVACKLKVFSSQWSHGHHSSICRRFSPPPPLSPSTQLEPQRDNITGNLEETRVPCNSLFLTSTTVKSTSDTSRRQAQQPQ